MMHEDMEKSHGPRYLSEKRVRRYLLREQRPDMVGARRRAQQAQRPYGIYVQGGQVEAGTQQYAKQEVAPV
jgi:hypothetical protein